MLSSQIRSDTITQFSSSAKPLPPDDQKGSPPCSTSTALVSASVSHSKCHNVLLLNPFSVTALLFKMEEANIASRAKAQEFIQATSQVKSPHPPSSSSSVSSQVPPPPSHAPPPGPTPAQFILHSSVPLVGCTKTPPPHFLPGLSMGGGCYLKKLHTQERAVEEVKLAIKPYYQRKDINKDEYKDILRKAVHKICHSRTGEINPVKVSNLVKLYVQRYKYFRKHGRKMDEEEKEDRESASMHSST
uniref:SFR19-like C-terminal domain-containing protein n=1 Tax=Sinocyclocheilus grahami TaxID=75366 RepID=A0A672QZ24_SINGR